MDCVRKLARAPLFLLEEVEYALNNLEVCVIRIARHDDQETKNRLEHLAHVFESIGILSFYFLAK